MVLKVFIHNYYIGIHFQYVKGDNSVKTQLIIFKFGILICLIVSNIFRLWHICEYKRIRRYWQYSENIGGHLGFFRHFGFFFRPEYIFQLVSYCGYKCACKIVYSSLRNWANINIFRFFNFYFFREFPIKFYKKSLQTCPICVQRFM